MAKEQGTQWYTQRSNFAGFEQVFAPSLNSYNVFYSFLGIDFKMADTMYSRENPVFEAFVFYSALLLLKMLFVQMTIPLQRVAKNVSDARTIWYVRTLVEPNLILKPAYMEHCSGNGCSGVSYVHRFLK